jgi:hypothetical protein
MKKLKSIILSIVAIAGISLAVCAPTVGAIAPPTGFDACSGTNESSTICTGSTKDTTLKPFLQTGVNIMFFIVGALAIIMIIFSGIQYVISAGDSGKVAKAKNTLTYSIVGLVIAFLAYAIVNWVIAQIQNGGTGK